MWCPQKKLKDARGSDKHRILSKQLSRFFHFFFFGGGGFNGIPSSSLRYAFAVLKDQFHMVSRPRRAAWCQISLLSLKGEPLLSFPLASQSQHTTNGLDPEEDRRSFIEWPLSPIIFTTLSIREFKHLTPVSISTCGHPGLHTSL